MGMAGTGSSAYMGELLKDVRRVEVTGKERDIIECHRS
jgi:hypothetical protein